jgi:hypothetical protein
LPRMPGCATSCGLYGGERWDGRRDRLFCDGGRGGLVSAVEGTTPCRQNIYCTRCGDRCPGQCCSLVPLCLSATRFERLHHDG